MPTAYCTECDWQREASEDEITALGRAMIDHHVETGHGPIERRDVIDRVTTGDRLDSRSGAVDRSCR
ncbi:hypothetical protein ACFO5R_11765 [Halosolutus amylolyticus]|uniref:DUF1059 domain-containing protein n=1 Tax=Halosolutus amylolyticus TaxID=2932267 RepID=A0ABD5PRN1_9EURY|nr:hypothetical protein [Halosolutus amylolyticus]